MIDSKVVNAGKPNGTLLYKDGMIKLAYSGGDDYHTSPPVPRTSELVFVCDHTAGYGQPQFLQESNHTYSFLWHTALVCPQTPIECTVTNPTTFQDYDLSRYQQ